MQHEKNIVELTENENIISTYEQAIADIEEISKLTNRYDDYLSYVKVVASVIEKASANLDSINIQTEIFGYNRNSN